MSITQQNPWSMFSSAFKMMADDRFHKILVSGPIVFQNSPDANTILSFYIIKRAGGTFTMVCSVETFEKGASTSRKDLVKDGITPRRIDLEYKALKAIFSRSMEEKSGRDIAWNVLDLAAVEGAEEQCALIREWKEAHKIDVPPVAG